MNNQKYLTDTTNWLNLLLENASPRQSLFLCLDASKSMESICSNEADYKVTGQKHIDGKDWNIVTPINNKVKLKTHLDCLNEGLHDLFEFISNDPILKDSVETTIIGFSQKSELIRQAQLYKDSDKQIRINSSDDDGTNYNAAISSILERYRYTIKAYRETGSSFYKPLCFFISDGVPTVPLDQDLLSELIDLQVRNKLCLFPIALDESAIPSLSRLSTKNKAFVLNKDCFTEFFKWVSKSVKKVSSSLPDQDVCAPNPKEETSTDWLI